VTGQIELTMELARELELAEANAAVRCVEAAESGGVSSEFAIEAIAGGFAVYCGHDSPITQAVGLGLHGPVSEEEFNRLESFYFDRHEAVRVETCPMADTSLVGHYGRHGYRVSEFSNVMAVRPEVTAVLPPSEAIEIRAARPDEFDLWARTVAQGFAEGQQVSEEIVGIMKQFASVPGSDCYLARIEGCVVGGATLAIRGRIAGLFGASTLLEFRRRGVQTALLRARLRRASELGCGLAMSIALPGSISQRNMSRAGFQTLYTRAKFERACQG